MIASWIAAAVSASFGMFQLAWAAIVVARSRQPVCGLVFLMIPRLCPLGELVAPLTFVIFAYLSVGFICYTIGTGFRPAVLLPGRRHPWWC